MFRKTSTFYLILIVAIGLSSCFILSAVIKSLTKPFTGSVRDATESCGTSRWTKQKKLVQDPFLQKRANLLSLEVELIQFTASSHLLIAKTKGGKTEVGVSQPDYGIVKSIHRTQSGEIFVIGDQISYRLNASVDNGVPVLSTPTPLPLLFSEACGLFGRITRSCPPNIAIYSQELDTIFLHGYTSLGAFNSFALGLATGDRNISHSGTPFFIRDIPNTGRVLLRGSHGFAFFDGQEIVPCSMAR